MADITWNRVGNPNFSDSNQLQALASQQLVAAGAGLKDTAQDYQDALRKRNHGLLQEYINQAKTPEELQSESFQQGFKNLQSALKNEYDAAAMSQYKDSRADLLTKRASDQVALERNQLGLTTDKTKEATRIGMNSLLALVNDPMAYAAKRQELIDANLYDPGIEQAAKLGAAQLTQTNNEIDLYEHTKGERYRAPKLENDAREAATESALGQLKIAQAKAPHEIDLLDAQAAAARAKPLTDAAYKHSAIGILGEDIPKVRKIQAEALNGVSGKFPYRTMGEVDTAITKDGGSNHQFIKTSTAAMDAIKKTLNDNEGFKALPDPVKASVYATTIAKMQNNNLFGSNDWIVSQGNLKEYAQFAQEAINEHTAYIQNARKQEQIAIQDMASRLSRETGTPYDVSLYTVRRELGSSPLDQYDISQEALKKIQDAATKKVPVVVPTSTQPAQPLLSSGDAAPWFKQSK